MSLCCRLSIFCHMKNMFVCLFVCIDRFKLRVTTLTYIAGMQMPCTEFVSPDTLLDVGFCSPQLDTSLRLEAPVSWEMSLRDEHRNRTLLLQLGHFSWLFFQCHRSSATSKSSVEGALTFANLCKTSICP